MATSSISTKCRRKRNNFSRAVVFLFTLSSLAPAGELSPGRKYTTLQRLETEHLEATHQARLKFAKERKDLPEIGVYNDYRAVIHVHAEDADHTKGTRAEVLQAAKALGLNVVMFTDHRGPKPDTWNGMREGILFIAGSEDDHLLRFPKPGAELRFLSHLEETPDAKSDGFDGMEIYNRHTDAKDEKEFDDYFRRAAKDPVEWAKLVEKEKKYPDEVFGAETDYWPSIMAQWDRELAHRPFPGIAANDSHKNQIYNGTVFDPYEVSFRSDITHILARELTGDAIRDSLRNGHVYVAHDWLCDATGFRFVAGNNYGVYDIGDHVPFVNNTRLVATLPIAAKIKLIHNGAVISETEGSSLTYIPKETGAYRLEAWLAVDGEERPWIYASPIYLKPPEQLHRPPTDLAPTVEAHKDITYVDGKPEDAAKHKLDIYAPKDKTNLPVLVFYHGGSWRSGDRSNYPALGNHFAQQGLLVVIPSYRLMPTNPDPAQTEDATAALDWTIKNIAQYGGDPKRIYIAGHSAGGHLAAYVGLEQKFWPNLKAVMPLSGVYDVHQIPGFEKDPDNASPIRHIHSGAPPFLITYCENDYPALPYQARAFDAALHQAGDSSKLVYVPGENHITEIIDVVKDTDTTSQAILQFISAHP